MLYEAIRLGCELYHAGKIGTGIDDLQLDRRKWNEPEILEEDVREIKGFLNKFKTRAQASESNILHALKETLPDLDKLQGKSILNVDLDDDIDGVSVEQIIESSFSILANCSDTNNRRYESSMASKILHVVNSELFVIWDRAIRSGYGIREEYKDAYKYTDYPLFLRRMQKLARYAITQAEEDSLASCPISCKHSLAKVLDEYNFMKFTQNDDRVWEKEYGP